MSIEDEVFELARIVPRDPDMKELPPGTDDAAIDAFESRTGLRVPLQLRTWLKFTNGSTIGNGGVFGINPTWKYASNIELWYKLCPRWREKGWIPVAGDGCGSYYVLATLPADGPGNPVFFVDHETSPDVPDYVVASDLFHFLRFYFRRDLKEEGWPFDPKKVLAEDPALADYHTVPKGWESTD